MPKLRLPRQSRVPYVPITVGASIQTAIDANPAGTRFSLAAGTWNDQVFTPKVGNHFVGAAGGGTILHGNDITASIYVPGGSPPDLNVLFKNIRVTHYGNSDAAEYRVGAIHGANNWTFRDCTFDFNNGWGLVCTEGAVINCRINDNRHGGISPKHGTLIKGNEIARNNSRGDDIHDDAAGLKSAGTYASGTNLRILYNYVHDNTGHGLWLDYTAGGNTIRGNTVIDNTSYGIMVEVTPADVDPGAFSYAVTEVSHNVVNNNGGIGIFVCESNNVQVNNNNIRVAAGDNMGLLMQLQDRPPDNANVMPFENNTALYNTITLVPGSGVPDGGNGARDLWTPDVHGTGNTIDWTTYKANSASSLWFWWTSPQAFAAYQSATGQDANSTCTSGDGSVPGFTDIGGNSDPC